MHAVAGEDRLQERDSHRASEELHLTSTSPTVISASAAHHPQHTPTLQLYPCCHGNCDTQRPCQQRDRAAAV